MTSIHLGASCPSIDSNYGSRWLDASSGHESCRPDFQDMSKTLNSSLLLVGWISDTTDMIHKQPMCQRKHTCDEPALPNQQQMSRKYGALESHTQLPSHHALFWLPLAFHGLSLFFTCLLHLYSSLTCAENDTVCQFVPTLTIGCKLCLVPCR